MTEFDCMLNTESQKKLGKIENAHKVLVRLRTGVSFINILHAAFVLVDPKSVKKILMTWLNSYAFGSYGRKSCL